MKIAYIGLRGIPAEYSGIERAVEEIGTRVAERGHEVSVYCMATRYENKNPSYKGIKLIYLPSVKSKNFEMIIYAFASSLAVTLKKYDIIHYHALGPSTMAFIPKLFNKKIAVTVHGLDWQRSKWSKAAKAYLKMGEWTSAKLFKSTLVVSRVLKKYYENKYGKEIIYIPNGVNIPSSEKSQCFIEKLGLKKNGYILFVGRLVPEKGCHHLIKAFKEIKTDKKLVIAGDSAGTDNYVKELHKMAVSDRIVFTGFLKGKELRELYSHSCFYVHPSELEGLSISILEAMSYGKCVLISDIEENLEIISDEHGLNGMTFINKNIKDLTSKLNLLLKDEQLVQDYGNKAKQHIIFKYNWDKITDDTLKVYSELLSNDNK